MSGKIRRDIARSTTLSQISSFSGQVDGCYNAEPDQESSVGLSFQASVDVVPNKNKKPIDLNAVFANTKRVSSLRLSPCQAKSLSNNLVNKLDILINANSEYDLDCKDDVVESREVLEIDDTVHQVNKKCGAVGGGHAKESIFKQPNTLQQKLKSSLFSASHLENSSSNQTSDIGGLGNLTSSQDQGFDTRFNLLMKNLNLNENQDECLEKSGFGSLYSSKQFKEKDCSIIYNSLQMDMSCSLTQRIVSESRRLNSTNNNNQTNNNNNKTIRKTFQRNNTLIEEDEDNPMFSSNPSYANKVLQTNQDKHKAILNDHTQRTISRLNYLNQKINELEQDDHSNPQIQKKTRQYVTEKLRIMKRCPFASTQNQSFLSSSSQQLQSLHQTSNPFINSQTSSASNSRIHQTKSDFQTFHSNQSSIIQRENHFIRKITLDIDVLQQRDICMTSEELYTCVLPLDPHFPNVILLGTLSGKMQLYQLSNEKPRKKYIQKLSTQIFPINEEQPNQEYPTFATQYKSIFYIGGSQGSIHVYDFKKKSIISTISTSKQMKSISNNNQTDSNSIDKSIQLQVNSIGELISIKPDDSQPINSFAITNIKVNSRKVLFTKQNGEITIKNLTMNNNNINETLFESKIDGLIKCDFSCDNDNNIIILTDEKLTIIYTPLNKIVYKLQSIIQENMLFVDFQINTLTKEVILLQNSQFLQQSRIDILKNKTTRLRTIESLSTKYILNSILLDKQMQNLFCIGIGEIKIWSYFNQNEFRTIQDSLLDKLSDPDEILTTNDSNN